MFGILELNLIFQVGMAGSFTDFHIDFGGSAVWYHVLTVSRDLPFLDTFFNIFQGQKIFYIIEPSAQNLALFAAHQKDKKRSENFFGEFVQKGDCRKLIVSEGETLFIPAGWIHAVYTPIDSIVFGGNFLHSMHIPMQIQ